MKYFRAIIRFILFFALTFGIYSIWFLGNIVIPNKQYWRQVIFRNWAIGFVRISGMQIEVLGEKPTPPFFLVSNHLGYMDIPVLRSVIECVFVTKGELKSWFIGGRAIGNMGNIYIDRKNRRDIPRAGDDVIKTLDGGEGVIIFPEGTSSKGEEVLPFNSSFFEFAAKTDLPIHYASITYQVSDQGVDAGDTICWWDDTSFVIHLWRFFQLTEFKAIINFGCEPIVNPNRKALAKALWSRVNEKFIPVL